MTFRALEKSIRVLEKSWKSPGNLFLKKGTNPAYLVKFVILLLTTAHQVCGCYNLLKFVNFRTLNLKLPLRTVMAYEHTC